MRILISIVFLLGLFSGAEARQRVSRSGVSPECNVTMPCEGVAPSRRGERVVRAMGGFGVAKPVYTPRVARAEPRRMQRQERPVREVKVNWNERERATRMLGIVPKTFPAPPVVHTRHAAQIVAHPEGCPRSAFCGCGAMRYLGLSDRSLWLARSWFRYPPAAPAPRMVAVRSHHVMVLVAQQGDGWLVYDANSGGHQTRMHVRSLAGYSIRNPSA